jgi:hypothetical protein
MNLDNRSTVPVAVGRSAAAQEEEFTNATLQEAGEFTLSIATYLTIPPAILGLGEQALAEYLQTRLGLLTAPDLRFDVQVGRTADDDADAEERE